MSRSQFADELRSLIDDLAAANGPDLWAALVELGLPRIGIEEERGGAGGSLDDLLVVVESLAGHGIGVPVVEASTADWILGHTGKLADGLATVLLLAEAPDATSGTVSAELTSVPWARDATRLVLCAPGSAPFLVNLGDPTVHVRNVDNIAGEPRDTVVLTGTPVTAAEGGPAYEEVRERLALLWSAAVLGASHGAYRLTRTYVSEREQFGAPLLKIPAVAGNLARMRVQLVQADAALSLAREARGSSGAVEIVRITTAAAATEIAQIAHQLHGAMGITEEYPLHRLTRRLWSWRDAVASERRWAESLGRRAAEAGETGVWTRITAPAATPASED
ncbi:acyl-CoA dehydrogenase family protein [Streptomyces zaomyceticus]|uniref:acyl-CoA dehydrogenase family protein n=1 Tax=Streptomyces zaomyceticus TaxID=68286 RepID=UPI001673867B|nr:acyl-CoA dehydrogenase family protein [Streptomyces zaomyceticus]GHG42648.1 acyl-CoA dehydrogenase [Streptomyces zaomyceticus]